MQSPLLFHCSLCFLRVSSKTVDEWVLTPCVIRSVVIFIKNSRMVSLIYHQLTNLTFVREDEQDFDAHKAILAAPCLYSINILNKTSMPTPLFISDKSKSNQNSENVFLSWSQSWLVFPHSVRVSFLISQDLAVLPRLADTWIWNGIRGINKVDNFLTHLSRGNSSILIMLHYSATNSFIIH